MPLDTRKSWIDPSNQWLSVNEQLLLATVSKTAYYYEPVPESDENLFCMEIIDKVYTLHPFYGSRKMRLMLQQRGFNINRKRVVRLMRLMGLEAFYPKRNLSKASAEHKKYPYLLRGVVLIRPNQVWSTDITYIPLKGGFLYLVAIIDWYTRFVLSWRLSNTLDNRFCIEALEEAFQYGKPEIFNTDQGVQFTSVNFIEILEAQEIKISMDGKGRALDNVIVERLWRSVKYEDVYINRYETGLQAKHGLEAYFKFYNNERPHQSLDYKTPYLKYFGELPPAALPGDFTLLSFLGGDVESLLNKERLQCAMMNNC